MTKCCYIHFKPKSSPLQFKIENFPIKKLVVKNLTVQSFLEYRLLVYVIIDFLKMSWEPHVTALRCKLSYASTTPYKIRDSVPDNLHQDLYHTLFESNLTYSISVWGGANKSVMAKAWTAQKHCVRTLFGNKAVY